jgi:hypothetical protein
MHTPAPNLASYLEENLPLRKITFSQCPWQNIANQRKLFGYNTILQAIYIPKCIISSVFYGISPYDPLFFCTTFGTKLRQALVLTARFLDKIKKKADAGDQHSLTMFQGNFRLKKVSQLFRDLRRSNSASPNSWIGGDDSFTLLNL